MSAAAYKKALSVLKQLESTGDLESFREALYTIAESMPSALNVLVPSVSKTVETFIVDWCIPQYTKIACINICRAIESIGITEAKQIVEQLNPTNVYGKESTAGLSNDSIQEMYARYLLA